ncbi:ABC transporter permease [Candidatus Parcubacteria bacterium]|nr:MAG: ABC transporter permease [Candidatus Parcubacteria bacterium]
MEEQNQINQKSEQEIQLKGDQNSVPQQEILKEKGISKIKISLMILGKTMLFVFMTIGVLILFSIYYRFRVPIDPSSFGFLGYGVAFLFILPMVFISGIFLNSSRSISSKDILIIEIITLFILFSIAVIDLEQGLYKDRKIREENYINKMQEYDKEMKENIAADSIYNIDDCDSLEFSTSWVRCINNNFQESKLAECIEQSKNSKFSYGMSYREKSARNRSEDDCYGAGGVLAMREADNIYDCGFVKTYDWKNCINKFVNDDGFREECIKQALAVSTEDKTRSRMYCDVSEGIKQKDFQKCSYDYNKGIKNGDLTINTGYSEYLCIGDVIKLFSLDDVKNGFCDDLEGAQRNECYIYHMWDNISDEGFIVDSCKLLEGGQLRRMNTWLSGTPSEQKVIIMCGDIMEII